MLDYQVEGKDEKGLTADCNCPACQRRAKKDGCDCESCRQDQVQDESVKVNKQDNCEWKNIDQLRERRYPSGQNGKFAWEINCECAGCKGD